MTNEEKAAALVECFRRRIEISDPVARHLAGVLSQIQDRKRALAERIADVEAALRGLRGELEAAGFEYDGTVASIDRIQDLVVPDVPDAP